MNTGSGIAHHPSDETLLRYAAGRLPAGASVVIATHLEGCPVCRARFASFAAMGGRLVEEASPELMAPNALAEAMARIDALDATPPTPPPARIVRHDIALDLPRALSRCDVGRWRWFGPGVHLSRVTIPEAPAARLTLLRVGAGRALPEHGHSGLEFTQVLTGSFTDEFGTFRPGDLAEMDSEVEHQPVVDKQGECICLAAFDGEMVLSGLLGRLVQPFLKL